MSVRAKASGEIVVHLVNYAGQRNSAYEEPPAISDLRLGVKGVKQGKALVAGTEVVVSQPDGDGYAWIDVPPVKHFEVLVLALAEDWT
jgi:hypothetical protein